MRNSVGPRLTALVSGLLCTAVAHASIVLTLTGASCDVGSACAFDVYLEPSGTTGQEPSGFEQSTGERKLVRRIDVGEAATEIDLGTVVPGRLVVESDSYWCATDDIAEVGEERRVTCKLVPAGRLSGTFEVESDEDKEESLAFRELSVRLVNDSSERPRPLDGRTKGDAERDFFRVHCPVLGHDFSCVLPVGTYDALFELSDVGRRFHSSHFFGDLTIGSKPSHLGSIYFTPGARVSGWLESRSEEAELEPEASVTLLPRLGFSAAELRYTRSLERLALEASIGEHGRFHIVGVAAGDYVLTAQGAGACPTIRQIRVPRALEAIEIEEPVLLDRCAALGVMVEPPVDFWGGPWRVELRQRRLLTGTLGGKILAELELNGWGRLNDLPMGPWSVEIQDSRGATWWARDVELEMSEEELYVPLESIEVRGSVRRGEDPVPGTIIFGTRSRVPSIPLVVEEDGHFQGFLPWEGDWSLEVEDGGRNYFPDAIRVERKEGKSYAEVLLELSGTLVEGTVLQGTEPVEGAFVYVFRKTARLEKETFAITDDTGAFVVEGVRPGTLVLFARSAALTTVSKTLEVADEEEIRDVTLVLQEQPRLRGRVTSWGAGLAGARLVAFGRSGGVDLEWDATTGIDGSFSMDLHPGVDRVSLAVGARGHAVEIRAVAVEPQAPKDLAIDLQPVGGWVVLPLSPTRPRGHVGRGGAVVPLTRLVPRLLLETGSVLFESGELANIHVAPGTWTFCIGDGPECRQETIPAGQRLVVSPRDAASSGGS